MNKNNCEHNKIKIFCDICTINIPKFKNNKIQLICKHKKNKYYCKECDGRRICKHDKRIDYCLDCNGSQICEHDIRKDFCLDCNGSQVCEHKIIKNNCIDCSPLYCIHKIRKTHCRECDGKLLCKNKLCNVSGRKKYEGYCIRCYANKYPENICYRQTNYLTKELNTINYVLKIFSIYNWSINLNIKKINIRPDLLLDLDDRTIIIEIDENQHKHYNLTYETQRVYKMKKYFIKKPFILIKFNPDNYVDFDGEEYKSCWIKENNTLRLDENKLIE